MSGIPSELVTLRDLVRWGASRFTEAGLWYGHGTDNALDEALALVLHGLHLGHDLPESYLDTRVTDEERATVTGLLRRRVEERIPAAYLTGRAWFAGLEFEIDQRVLVPRSPIAELIDAGFQPWLGEQEPVRILDLCTGSGCIAIACALAFPDARVDATDVSADALEVATRNRERYRLERRLNLTQGDLFAGLDGERYDLIVSNPPYVDAEELVAMPAEYRHEPEIGLAAGADGLDIVRRILAEAPERLSATGIIVVEVGASALALQDTYPEVPFCWIEFENGGEGVFVLTAEQVQEHRATLTGRCD